MDLTVMERVLVDLTDRSERITLSEDPDWGAIAALDLAAFEGFWHMSEEGLQEAMDATARSAVLEAYVDAWLAGYAIVGVSMGISYLQRIATHPRFRATGIGSALVIDACHWGRAAGSSTMVLNVKPDNIAAIRLYAREGFVETGNHLHVLRYPRKQP